MKSVAVLVLTWNGQDYIQPCLAALAQQQYTGQYGVLVVDNGSTDETVALVDQHTPRVALIRNDYNLGFAGGNNVGLRALLAGTAPAPLDGVPDMVVLLNQDTEVAPDWLAHLVATFEERPDVGIAGCKILFPDGTTLQHTGGGVEWPLGTGKHRGAGEPDEGQYDDAEAAAAIDYVTGAAMAIRTSVLDMVGLLDDGYTPAYFEDVDLCYRARAAGFALAYVPHAALRHAESTSLEGQSARHQRAYHRNRLRFVLRHCPLEQLTHDFAPAERAEMQQWSLRNSLARKHAYVDNLLALPAIVAQRDDSAAATAQLPHLVAMLRSLHQYVVAEERARRAETAYDYIQAAPPPPTTHAAETPATMQEEVSPASADTAETADAAAAPTSEPPQPTPEADAATEPALAPGPPAAAVFTTPRTEEPTDPEPPVDVAAIMRQVRRQISERQGHHIDHELHTALDSANQQWNEVYEPLQLAPTHSLHGRVWDALRTRLHHEVRSYLDTMVFRQTEFNASVVRVLNTITRRSHFAASTAELEALSDEVVQLRERVRQLEERREQQP